MGTVVACLPLANAAPAPRQIVQLLHRSRHGWPADLSGASLAEFDLTGIDFKSATLTRADLFGADLTDANLAGAQLGGSRLDRAVITRAEFSGCNLEGASLLNLTVFTGLERHHREAARFAGARIAGAAISGYLDYCDFRWTDLRGARFGVGGGSTTLIGAKFSECQLQQARFGSAPLTFAHFARADLAGADLSGCELSQADFTGANVTGMNVAGADLHDAFFTGARGIETLKGLDQARNAGRMRSG
ncbi:MAG: pentapeptide repeat-containing protein [Hyphomicrobium sp.]